MALHSLYCADEPLRNCSLTHSIALRLPPSTADIYDQPTSISWLYRAVGGLHLAVGLSLRQARPSGTHYWLSFAVCVLVLATLDARLRRYCSCSISAFSAIEMLCIILCYINFLFCSIIWMYYVHSGGNSKGGETSAEESQYTTDAGQFINSQGLEQLWQLWASDWHLYTSVE